VRLSRLDLYELCVQNPVMTVRLLRAIHGQPRVLREDFCGTAAVSREWVRAVEGGGAIAVDLDERPLARARREKAVSVIRGDALRVASPCRTPADAIFVGNFSIGEIHERTKLVAYLRACRGRLARDGVFVCDIYGGVSAHKRGSLERTHPGPARMPDVSIRYAWEQREVNPLSGMVTNALHFRVLKGGQVVQQIGDAFVYHWRLWSIAELREAMSEAGFKSTAVYNQLPDAVDSEGRYYIQAVEDVEELGESYIVCVAGRK
jgi:hypothetical protein